MKDNIIEFDVLQKKARLENLPDDLPAVNEATEIAGDKFLRTVMVIEMTANAMTKIAEAGLDAAQFHIDEESVERFYRTNRIGEEGAIFNGLCFDWEDQDILIRVVATVMVDDDGNPCESIIDILRIEPGDRHWEWLKDGEWVMGPPAEFFRALDVLENMDDWDEDDDEWESSIDSMMLSPGTMGALHEAGIHTIDELRELSDAELLKLKGIGKKRVEEIREALEYED